MRMVVPPPTRRSGRSPLVPRLASHRPAIHDDRHTLATAVQPTFEHVISLRTALGSAPRAIPLRIAHDRAPALEGAVAADPRAQIAAVGATRGVRAQDEREREQ